jgi:hypothetical protein
VAQAGQWLGYGLGDRGSILGRGNDSMFLLAIASRPALRPTQPPIQWVPGALSLGVKRPGCEADHSPPSNAEIKECVELYLHSPHMPSWRGAQLKETQGQLYFYTWPSYYESYLKSCTARLQIRQNTDR